MEETKPKNNSDKKTTSSKSNINTKQKKESETQDSPKNLSKNMGTKTEKIEKESKIIIDTELKKDDNNSIEPKSTQEDALADIPESIRKKLEQNKQNAKQKSTKRKKKSKEKKHITVGKAFIKATYNNTIISLTDVEGNVISWASTGMAGFKGPKKSTSYAAQIITRIASEKAKNHGLEEVSVYVRGVGTGREAVIRTLNSSGITINTIKDVTPVPHNGCRPTGPRRI